MEQRKSTKSQDVPVDYSIYLVTDSSDKILGARNLLEVVRKALEGGVCVVQYREKKMEAKAMVAQAVALKTICHEYGAKFIVNDRVDVAFAAGADGVHLGQDDIDIKHARQLLGPNAIIGISCSTVEEAIEAIQKGADYLGIGAVYATSTKNNVSGIIGITGIRDIVSAVGTYPEQLRRIPCVAIGGLNATNIHLLRYKTHTANGGLAGVAVVSAIMGAEDATTAAKTLRKRWSEPPPWVWQPRTGDNQISPKDDIFKRLAQSFMDMIKVTPISHNMTNPVVTNFAANVAIAVGASPIMSTAKEEAADLAKLGGGLVVNIGSVTLDNLFIFLAGLQAYNDVGGPVLLDPVAVGATKMRYTMVSTLMDRGHFDIIKGNKSEIQALALGFSGTQRGVDSAANNDEFEMNNDNAAMVCGLARRERCVVLMTGEIDYLSDGSYIFRIQNGVSSLSSVTGTGCALGSVIVAFAAAYPQDKLIATLAATLFYEIAAEIAEEDPTCAGPGHFIPCFLDALARLRKLVEQGKMDWFVERANFYGIDYAHNVTDTIPHIEEWPVRSIPSPWRQHFDEDEK